MFEGGDARTGGDQTVLNFNSAASAGSTRSLVSDKARSEAGYPVSSSCAAARRMASLESSLYAVCEVSNHH
jgi:hypothetical protein